MDDGEEDVDGRSEGAELVDGGEDGVSEDCNDPVGSRCDSGIFALSPCPSSGAEETVLPVFL